MQQTLLAFQIETGQLTLGLRGGQLRVFLAGIELHQQIPFLHRPAGFKRDPLDHAQRIGAHYDAVDRLHRTDGGEGRVPMFLPGDG